MKSFEGTVSIAVLVLGISCEGLAQQVTGMPPRGPGAGDSSVPTALIQGQTAAERTSTGGAALSGFVRGLFLGPIGAALSYAIESDDNPGLTRFEFMRLSTASEDYKLAFRRGFEDRLRSRRAMAALKGGLMGTAALVVAYVVITN